MTILQQITTRAKQLKKSHPKTKWTDLIKKASKEIKGTKRKSGKVGDYKLNDTSFLETRMSLNPRKKKVAKPKKYAVTRNADGSFKKGGVKRIAGNTTHKDSKSHNVKISVMSGVKRPTGYIGRVLIKKYTLSELKKLNSLYFAKGTDKAFGVYKRKLLVSPLLNSQVMVEAHKNTFGGKTYRHYTVRVINSDGSIGSPKRFENIMQAAGYIGKNIIL